MCPLGMHLWQPAASDVLQCIGTVRAFGGRNTQRTAAVYAVISAGLVIMFDTGIVVLDLADVQLTTEQGNRGTHSSRT